MARKQKGSMSTRDPRDVVTAWAEDVVAGRIVSGAFERELAAQHLSDLKTGHKRGIVWDLEAALRGVAYMDIVGGAVLTPRQAFAAGFHRGWKNNDGSFAR